MFIDYTNTHGSAYNDGDRYGVTISTVADPTQPHWRVVGVHHLDGNEGGGNNVYIDIIDKKQNRIFGAVAEARNVNGFVEQLRIHKTGSDHGADTVLFGNDTKSIKVTQNGLPSDSAHNFHTRHPNELDEHGNPTSTTMAHHAFYLVFQYSPGVTSPGGENGDEGGVTVPPDGVTLETLLWATGELLVQGLNRNAALYRKAQKLGLGEHLTAEYDVLHNGLAYVAQIFELGLVYAPMGQWDQVQMLESGTRSVGVRSLEQVVWDHHITGFYGSRWAYFEQHVQSRIPGLPWPQFNETFSELNPHVTQDSGVILPQKQYIVPRLAGQPASPASQPATNGAAAAPPAVTIAEAAPAAVTAIPPEFVQIHNEKFHIKGRAERFVGVNIRGLVHYGHDPAYFANAPAEHRAIQLQAAKDMNARLVRVFLAHKDATPAEVERRLRDTINLIKSNFPEIYLMPALTNLYKDVPFYVQGDEAFYEVQTPGGKEILNHTFYGGRYQDNYLPFVEHIVTQFKNEPQILAWEIGNELKADNNSRLLVDFMTTMAARIKTLDPNHLVTTGMISTRHGFMIDRQDPLRDELYSSPHIDFVTIHPYNGNKRIPPEMGNPEIPIEDDMDLARKHHKPLIVEEAGFDLRHYNERADKTRDDMAYWFGEGASCYMPWGFVKTPRDNGDGDEFIGMTGPLHNDFTNLFELHRQCGHILRETDINQNVSETIKAIGYRQLETELVWPVMVDGFDFPVGKPDADAYYVAAGLVDPSYRTDWGSWHTGEDWNGIGGRDTDLGDPVFAAAHGLVITAQSFPVWGNIVLAEHVLPTGQKVWSQYAHLNDMFVKKGDIVRRGEVVGTIGKGGDHRYLAHLHFEIRLRKLPASKAGWKTAEDREKVLRYYAHPTNFINSYRPR